MNGTPPGEKKTTNLAPEKDQAIMPGLYEAPQKCSKIKNSTDPPSIQICSRISGRKIKTRKKNHGERGLLRLSLKKGSSVSPIEKMKSKANTEPSEPSKDIAVLFGRGKYEVKTKRVVPTKD
ncbi:hypothetical protein TNIN_69351 [Trichonephila inaurata madagascariensis]|uniref:Uncharacterized protein n=1 Tax=Trichonephila inaurata madagascariensis TaxID=2747483 RepID=A0A8X7CDP7_9ARAC|nr:hypothetical protein TNIN_69351 [Trichonephila inaurata madagascariensis]